MKIFGIVACILTGFSESKMSGIDLVDFQKPGGSGGSRPSGGSSGSSAEDDVDLDYVHPCYYLDQNVTTGNYCEYSDDENTCWTLEQCNAVFASNTTITSTSGALTTSDIGQEPYKDTGPSVPWYPDVEPVSPTNNGRMTTFSVKLSLFLLFIEFLSK